MELHTIGIDLGRAVKRDRRSHPCPEWFASGCASTLTVDPSYRTGMEALTSSLDRIQHPASQTPAGH